MSASLLGQLHQTLTQLEALSPTDKQVLRQLLPSTLKTLHDLFPKHLPPIKRQNYIQLLLPLEKQFSNLIQLPPTAIDPVAWQQVHSSLQTVVKEALRQLS